MRLGRLAFAGLIAGAVTAFAIALLLPRRRSVIAPAAGDDTEFGTGNTDTPDPGGAGGRQEGLQVDVARAEKGPMIMARSR